MLNSMHITYRTTSYTVKLADMYIRGMIYNCWQAWRLLKKRKGIHHSNYTFNSFVDEFSGVIEEFAAL